MAGSGSGFGYGASLRPGDRPITPTGGADGYQFDPVKNTYVPIVGSPSDQLAQRGRDQTYEDTLRRNSLAPQPSSTPTLGANGSPSLSGLTNAMQETPNQTRQAEYARDDYTHTRNQNDQLAAEQRGSAAQAQGFAREDSLHAQSRTEQASDRVRAGEEQSATIAKGLRADSQAQQGLINTLKSNGLLNPIQAPTYGGSGGAPNTDAAAASIFGAGKDRAAQIANSSLTGLSSALAARGMGGAGYEAGQVGKIAGTAEGAVSAANRDTTQMQLGAEQHAADQNFQGAELTQEEEAARQSQLLGQLGNVRKPVPALTGLSAATRSY